MRQGVAGTIPHGDDSEAWRIFCARDFCLVKLFLELTTWILKWMPSWPSFRARSHFDSFFVGFGTINGLLSLMRESRRGHSLRSSWLLAAFFACAISQAWLHVKIDEISFCGCFRLYRVLTEFYGDQTARNFSVVKCTFRSSSPYLLGFEF